MAIRKIASIVGTRPQFIKAAPVSRVLSSSFEENLIHIGQQDSTSEDFFAELGMREPDYNLGVGSGSHAEQTGKIMVELERVFESLDPDLVLVYGDTNSSLAGVLAASKMQIPIAHVEAGLRSHNRTMPEEVNRVVIDQLSSILFCPTVVAVRNLEKEGIVKGVHNVGDVLYDALLHNLDLAREQSTILSQLGLKSGGYVLATVHRMVNTENQAIMQSILAAFGRLSTQVILPLHPRTRKLLAQFGLSAPPNVSLIDPVGYLDMLILEENADCILTDSGGIQKEAYLLGVRCITLRVETEWIETVEAGWNRLVGAQSKAILSAYQTWHPQRERPALYGDGSAAQKICNILKTMK